MKTISRALCEVLFFAVVLKFKRHTVKNRQATAYYSNRLHEGHKAKSKTNFHGDKGYVEVLARLRSTPTGKGYTIIIAQNGFAITSRKVHRYSKFDLYTASITYDSD